MFRCQRLLSRRNFLALLTQGLATVSVAQTALTRESLRSMRIAFGSCLKDSRQAFILDRVVEADPDLFVWLGDNIYGDTENMNLLKKRYAVLEQNPRFQRLRQYCPNLAIWDDHDYGANNAGEEYPRKRESREIFLNFWQVPQEDPRWQHDGIYGSSIFGSGAETVHIILLDGRSFRSTTKDGMSGTMLGDEQWRWLEQELLKPSAVKIICSGIQVLASEHGYEGWCEFPHEQRRLFELIRTHRVPGVVFVSGDQHWAEISKEDKALGYPAYDLTASSLDQSWPLPYNSLRVGRASPDPSFGMIVIEWNPQALLRFQIISADGTLFESQTVPLSRLQAHSDQRFL
jgi:alkaline phosphatase D